MAILTIEQSLVARAWVVQHWPNGYTKPVARNFFESLNAALAFCVHMNLKVIN